MPQESKTLAFFINESGLFRNVQHEIVGRLKKRLVLQEVHSVNDCDVIMAFVPIVSRAGTDIEAALKNIPTTRPVVLVVFHHTYDENYLAPNSRWSVNMEGVFAADFLCHEDVGLLKCLANEEALKSVTDHLISVSPSTPLIPVIGRRKRSRWICVAVCAMIVALLVLLICLLIPKRHGQDTLTTVIPHVTVTPQIPNISVTTELPNMTVTTQA